MNLQQVTESNPSFLARAENFLKALKKSKQLLYDLNILFCYGSCELEKSFDILERAKKTQCEYDNAFKDEEEKKNKIKFEKIFRNTSNIFRKQCNFFKVFLNQNPKKQLDLGLIGKPGTTTTDEWLTAAAQIFQKLIKDHEIYTICLKINSIRRLVIIGNKIKEARDAYELLHKNQKEIKLIIDNKDSAFHELIYNMAMLQSFIFWFPPKEFKNLELPLVHDEIGQEIMIVMAKESSIT